MSQPQPLRVIFSFVEATKGVLNGAQLLTELEADAAKIIGEPLQKIKGSYKGQLELSYLVTYDQYNAIYQHLAPALLCEESILILGEAGNEALSVDSRSRPYAILYSPNGVSKIAELGFFGNIDKRDKDAFDAWSDNGDHVFVAMPFADWLTYEALTGDGLRLADVGADWRTAKKQWVTESTRGIIEAYC